MGEEAPRTKDDKQPGPDASEYDPRAFEARWRARWEADGLHTFQPTAVADGGRSSIDVPGEPFYNLVEFPYPSAEGLHVGHVRTYAGADTFGRYQRMRGRNVFQPMGFDSFGIHAENYAIKAGEHPQRLTDRTVPRFREPEAQTAQTAKTAPAQSVNLADMEFGRYYALIIANQNYNFIENLYTPYSDAQRAKMILENQFGFKVKLLLDADNISVMRAINELNEHLTEKDNLLIFYAGHGSRIPSGDMETGYWLPVNASPPPEGGPPVRARIPRER
jgi:hypothetical protein